MMDAAQRNGEFVAHLSAHGARLGEPDVVRLAGLPAADGASLRGDEAQVLLVPEAAQLTGAAVRLLSR